MDRKNFAVIAKNQAGLIFTALRIELKIYYSRSRKSKWKQAIIGDNVSLHINIALVQLSQQNNISSIALPSYSRWIWRISDH